MLKKYLSVLLLLGVLLLSFAVSATPSPYRKEEHARFLNMENNVQLLKLPYNFTATNLASGETAALGFSIPADSFITGVSIFIESAVVSANSNTVALNCEGTADLDVAVDLSALSANAFSPGVPRRNDESTWVYSSTGCTPTLEVGAGASGLTAGRPVYYIEYVQVETLTAEPSQ